MPVHLECAKGAFNVLGLSTKNCNVFSLGHSPIPPIFRFLILHFSDNNVFHRIARFVICDIVKGGGSQF